MTHLIAFMKGCRAACVEEFNAIMEYTGWSQNVVFTVFFISVFFLLLLIVFGLYKFREKKHRYRSKYKKK